MAEIVQRCQRGVGTSRTLRVRTVCRSTDSQVPIRVAARSVAARLLELWVRIPRGHVGISLVRVCCCRVQVSAPGWSLVQSYRGPCVRVWSWSLDNEEALAH